MAVSVFRLDDERPFVYPDLMPGLEVLFFDPLDERGEDSIGDRYRSLDPSLRSGDILVIRSSARSIVSKSAEDPVIRKLGPELVVTLSRSHDPQRPHPVLTPIAGPTEDVTWDPKELRRAEVDSIIRRSGAVFEHTDHHYVLPSGWHAERFIRLANALRTIADCRRLADWVLADVTGDTDILADTGDLLPLIQEVQRHCQAVFGWRTRIDVLDEYPTLADIAERIGDMTARSVVKRRRTLFVVSVTSTGQSIKRFEQVLGGMVAGTALAICNTSAITEITCSAMASLPTARWLPQSNGECEECGSPARITIDPITYEPRTHYEISATPIAPRIAGANAELFQLLSDQDALRIHYTSERGAHYAVWVDTPQLLSLPELQDRYRRFIEQRVSGARIAIVPEGPAAGELVDIALSVGFEAAHLVSVEADFSEDLVQSVAKSEHVAIIDDVLVSGNTLRRLRLRVYNSAREFGRSPRVSGVVFLARPSRPSVLAEISRPFLGDRGLDLHHLEMALFPSGNECSWCREVLALRAVRSQLSANGRAVLDARLEDLSRELRAPALFGGRGSNSGLRTEGALFGDLKEVPALCAAASAVKSALAEMQRNSSLDSTKVIDVAVAMDAYFDDALLVGILRTCTRRQVRFASLDPGVSARYSRLGSMGSELSYAARCELAWAVASELLPKEGFEDVLVAAVGAEADLMREVLELGGGQARFREHWIRGRD